VVCLALLGLPLARPVPRLLWVDTSIGDLPKNDRGTVDRPLRQAVHKPMQLGLGHALIVARLPASPYAALTGSRWSSRPRMAAIRPARVTPLGTHRRGERCMCSGRAG